MGAWGPGPYDNDSAADWLGIVGSCIADHIEAGLTSPDNYKVRAACWLLGQVAVSSYTYDFEMRDRHFSMALDFLRQWEAQETHADWAESIRNQIEHLEAVRDYKFAEPGLMDRIAKHLAGE